MDPGEQLLWRTCFVSTSRSLYTLGVMQVPLGVPRWLHSTTLLWKKPQKRLETHVFGGVSPSEK